LESGKRAAVG